MKRYMIRYGMMRLPGAFSFAEPDDLRYGNRVIAATPRGQEVGIVRGEADPDTLAQFGSEMLDGRIIRRMSESDEERYRHIQQKERTHFIGCRGIIEQSGLEMTLIRVEHLFGGERMIVYYVADGRVDFRELVKVLTGEFRTRVEMRQIGVRDKTKLLADIGDCGRNVCCNNHLYEIAPVSMKMAKQQKATLDPTKISGLCCRLKCCFRYEYDQYLEREECGHCGKNRETDTNETDQT